MLARSPQRSFSHRLIRAGTPFFLLGISAGLLVAADSRPVPSAHTLPSLPADGPLPPAEAWHYARYLNFEILSQLPDGQTRRQIRAIAAVQRMVEFATGFEPRYSQPCLAIFHANKAAYLEFLPAADEELAERTARPTAVSGRKFLRGTEQTALVHFGDKYEDPFASGASIVHNIFQQIAPRPPVWFRVAVGDLIRVTDPEAHWNPRNFFADALAVPPTLPELFAAPLPSADALTINPDPAAPDSPFAAFHQFATVFVHFGLFADGGRHREKLIDLARHAAVVPITEPVFREFFGVGFDEMRVQLRAYMGSAAMNAVNLGAMRKQQLATLPLVELRAATPGEIGRIKGEARIMAGYGGDARREFSAAYRRGARDPELLAALGIAECTGVDKERARPLLEAAAAAGVARPMAYLQLARLRYPELRAAVGSDARLTRAQAAPVLEPLRKAHALKPPLAEVFQCFVVLFADFAEPLTPAEHAIVDEAARLFPRDAELVFAGAKLKRDQGDAAGAKQLIDAGLSVATNAGTRARFERLRATLTARLD